MKNSVTRHLGPDSKAATLLAMRSAKKEILIVVEGETDIDLYSNALSVGRSNLLSCGGKDILMSVFSMAPQKGIDEGTIFLRDRDFDNEVSREENGVLLLVTDLYDIEMELLEKRLFSRIFLEFSAGRATQVDSDKAFAKISQAAGAIGATRKVSKEERLDLDFDDLKYNRFLDAKTLSLNITDLIKYIFAKSQRNHNCHETTKKAIEATLSVSHAQSLACSKEFLDIMHIALHRLYDFCSSAECAPVTLARMIRVGVNVTDIKSLSLFEALKDKVLTNPYYWSGVDLQSA